VRADGLEEEMKIKTFIAWLIVAMLLGYVSGLLHATAAYDSFDDCEGTNVRSISECYGDE
jgi:hypothetical protein